MIVWVKIAAMIVTLMEMLELTNEWLLGLLGSVWMSQDSFSILEYVLIKPKSQVQA